MISTLTGSMSSVVSVGTAFLCRRIRHDEQSDITKLENGASILHRQRTAMRRDLLEVPSQSPAKGQQERRLTIENIHVKASRDGQAEYQVIELCPEESACRSARRTGGRLSVKLRGLGPLSCNADTKRLLSSIIKNNHTHLDRQLADVCMQSRAFQM